MKFVSTLFFALLLLVSCNTSRVVSTYSWGTDLHQRLLCDFSQSREQVKDYVGKYIPDVTESQIDHWTTTGKLENMMLDGKIHYFGKAAQNLFRIDSACVAIKEQKEGAELSAYQKVNLVNIPQIISQVRQQGSTPPHLGAPKRMRVNYTLTVKADAVPAGEKIRCWLPFPRNDEYRQRDVKLLKTSEQKYIKAPARYTHSTIYLEKVAEAGKPTVFSETFEYTSYGEKFFMTDSNIKPYNKNTKLYKEYTAEREKHIVFTPRLRFLADSLSQGLTTPQEKAKAFFCWIKKNYPWGSSREYSTLENIPEYVVHNGHGDCGQVSLLFITLCRLCGIPAHFESGFMMHPGAEGMHDWAEIYLEGLGWVPVDQSFGVLYYAQNEDEKMFFLGGIDSYRMIVNNDFGKPLYPRKTYPRSETVDFQRGEVEWNGGNIYFDKWNWHLDVTYLNQ